MAKVKLFGQMERGVRASGVKEKLMDEEKSFIGTMTHTRVLSSTTKQTD